MKSIFILFLILLFPLYSEEKNCENQKTEPKLSKCFQSKFESADKNLNLVYKELQSSLSKEKAAEMKKDSKEWITFKEDFCNSVKELNNGLKSAYYECLWTKTNSRTEFLEQAFGEKGSNDKIEGSYMDPYGGILNISKESKGHKFAIQVLRGPTYHTGELSGSFTIKNNSGIYEEKGDSSDSECKLEFAFSKRKVNITQDGCSLYLGARAYFSGLYYKVKPIKLEISDK